ncbi:hypothetical protein Nepgr_008038 [Nepenthes gracilis]|uniref:Uncharacterized protein n=1 Tax=Nepenthes gracilis TaxID=150966 RepID=A0AAD3S7Y8_NEPGR|nr:hypothetical protein Nepgr_008038 [Nepenthes gracilis]
MDVREIDRALLLQILCGWNWCSQLLGFARLNGCVCKKIKSTVDLDITPDSINQITSKYSLADLVDVEPTSVSPRGSSDGDQLGGVRGSHWKGGVRYLLLDDADAFSIGRYDIDLGRPQRFPSFFISFGIAGQLDLAALVDLVIGRFLLFVCVWLAVGNCLWSCFPPVVLDFVWVELVLDSLGKEMEMLILVLGWLDLWRSGGCYWIFAMLLWRVVVPDVDVGSILLSLGAWRFVVAKVCGFQIGLVAIKCRSGMRFCFGQFGKYAEYVADFESMLKMLVCGHWPICFFLGLPDVEWRLVLALMTWPVAGVVQASSVESLDKSRRFWPSAGKSPRKGALPIIGPLTSTSSAGVTSELGCPCNSSAPLLSDCLPVSVKNHEVKNLVAPCAQFAEQTVAEVLEEAPASRPPPANADSLGSSDVGPVVCAQIGMLPTNTSGESQLDLVDLDSESGENLLDYEGSLSPDVLDDDQLQEDHPCAVALLEGHQSQMLRLLLVWITTQFLPSDVVLSSHDLDGSCLNSTAESRNGEQLFMAFPWLWALLVPWDLFGYFVRCGAKSLYSLASSLSDSLMGSSLASLRSSEQLMEVPGDGCSIFEIQDPRFFGPLRSLVCGTPLRLVAIFDCLGYDAFVGDSSLGNGALLQTLCEARFADMEDRLFCQLDCTLILLRSLVIQKPPADVEEAKELDGLSVLRVDDTCRCVPCCRYAQVFGAAISEVAVNVLGYLEQLASLCSARNWCF